MSYPKYDGFSLQDDTYVVEEVSYRSMPDRALDVQKVARRAGSKLLATDFETRKVSMSGYIMADTVSALRDAIDNLHINVTRKSDGLLEMEEGRTANAIVSSLTIADPHYSQTFVPFSLEFLMSDPFFYGTQYTVTWNVPAGAFSLSDTITISGSVFSEPLITYLSATGAGYTTTSGIRLTYVDTGEIITWSGGNPTTLADNDTVTFDYVNHAILQGTTEKSIEGVFSRWEPGVRPFTVTFSGTSDAGGTLSFAYQARYL